jgi:putative hydrolase of the HAD superfamily
VQITVASGDVGAAKPDARIFEHACRLLGVHPRDAVYVGDRFETDALGAAGAGLTGVWLDRRATASGVQRRRAAASGVLIIASLDELATALAGPR